MESFQVHCCSICKTFRTKTFKKLLHHIRFTHSIEPNFCIRCGIDGCERKYRKYTSFYSHLRRSHKILFEGRPRPRSNVGSDNCGNSANEDLGLENTEAVAECTNLEFDDVQVSFPHNNPAFIPETGGERSSEQDFALFVLGIREKHKLPASVTKSIIQEVSELMGNNVRIGIMEIKEKLSNCGFTKATNPELFNFIDAKCEKSSQVFETFSTDYKETEFYKEHFGLVEPVEYVLGFSSGKADSFVYVPLLETLKRLLGHGDILAEVFKPHCNSVGKRYEDFYDGEVFQNHPLFSLEPNALQVHLYYDDFGMVNPLRNKANSYKMAAFYFVLGNLSPKYRAKLSSIQLVSLCYSRFIKKYGFEKVLKPFLEDVKILEEKGVTITTVNQEQFTFKGCITLISMDNLAAHQLGGFQQHFHAGRICRFCMASSDDIQVHFDSSSFTERTSVGHKHQLQLVMQNEGLRNVYGVVSKSVLSDLKYFDVISCLPPDPAHDLLEGLVPELIKKVVVTFIQEGYFTLDFFNNALKVFPYGKCDKKNKPTCSNTDTLASFKIKQTASQTWCLMRLLPLMVASTIPEGNEYWELYLTLMDICEITFAPSVPCEMVAYLEYLVHGFLVTLKELYPEDRLKPKSHYLLHYPNSLLKYGPLVHCWTMSENLKRFHVTFGLRKRVLVCTPADINHQIESEFEVKKFRTQVFYNDFDDWVDVNGQREIEEMEEKAIKLRVIEESDDVPNLSTFSSASSTCSDDTIILVGNDVPSTSDVSDSFNDEKRFLPWPKKFEINQDDVRKDMREQLLKGETVSSRMKSAVIQATFEKMCLYTIYPTTEQYNVASQAVITTFPCLTTKTRFCEPFDAVKNALKDKFRNERRHMKFEEVSKKRKKSLSSTGEPAGKRASAAIIPEGETEETIDMHVKGMQQDYTKKKPDMKKVKSLMAVTFGHRRSLILERKPIIDIKETYPFLFSQDMIMQDFSTLMGWENIDMFFRNVDRYANSIVNLPMNHSKENLQFLLSFKTYLQKMLSPEEKTDATRTAALWILPSLLKEDKNFLIINGDADVNSDIHINTPVVTFQDNIFSPSSVKVIAENQLCCECPSIPEAVLTVVGGYYVFDMKYNSKIRTTLTFIQNVFCEIKEKGKLSQKIVSLLAKLNV
ncbi:Sterile alpha motif domain-containing protein 3 [Holothuria leucospilota]|uniref:Sterile alpha motif domain-containing protein 3 n=1 Tax=Holothuria leucospilota TaxID=206669 RepID=A0A9Q1C057_HOLLE|nr:Sterile alpha motif domain-containing protein 3 [Holothuria leucospilota]